MLGAIYPEITWADEGVDFVAEKVQDDLVLPLALAHARRLAKFGV